MKRTILLCMCALLVTTNSVQAGRIKGIFTGIKKMFTSSNGLKYSSYLAGKLDDTGFDKLGIKALSDGGDGRIITNIGDKVMELEMRGMDLGDTLNRMTALGSGARTRALYRDTFFKEVDNFSRLIAHLHVTLVKNGNVAGNVNGLRAAIKSFDNSVGTIKKMKGLSYDEHDIFVRSFKVVEYARSALLK